MKTTYLEGISSAEWSATSVLPILVPKSSIVTRISSKSIDVRIFFSHNFRIFCLRRRFFGWPDNIWYSQIVTISFYNEESSENVVAISNKQQRRKLENVWGRLYPQMCPSFVKEIVGDLNDQRRNVHVFRTKYSKVTKCVF